MATEIKIYYEGDAKLRQGFDTFFRELRERGRARGCRIRFVACGSGETACQDFATAMDANPPTTWNVLLKDSEGPDTGELSASLCREQHWDRTWADSIFWMVAMMEAWFHADPDAIDEFYGTGFRRTALKRNPRVEEIPKEDLIKGLNSATKHCVKREYERHKADHGAALLERVDPLAVRKAAPNCARMFETILEKL